MAVAYAAGLSSSQSQSYSKEKQGAIQLNINVAVAAVVRMKLNTILDGFRGSCSLFYQKITASYPTMQVEGHLN